MNPHSAPRSVISFVAAIIASMSVAHGTEGGQGTPRYLLRDLGLLRGSQETVGIDMNNRGEIVGISMATIFEEPLPVTRSTTFLFRHRKLKALELLPGYTWSLPGRINDRGEVIAYQSVDGSYPHAPVLYSKGEISNLTTILGAGAWPSYKNNKGVIAGVVATPTQFVFDAFTFKDGTMTLLEGLVPGGSSGLLDINDTGDAVGYSTVEAGPPGVFHPVRFIRGGSAVNLGLLPGMKYGSADFINGSGSIIGNCSSEDLQRTRGFISKDGIMVGLDPLPGDTDSLAKGINGRGQVVGISSRTMEIDDGTALIQRACLFSNGQKWDLNQLIVGRTGWKLHIAMAINNKGEILAVGENRNEGVQRSCLLIPVGNVRH